jgi:enamine deaminase RidA (YjgF/YER057c/UK114 family)
VHIGDLHEQMSETLENLGSLLAAARPGATVGLSAFTDLRIYHPRPRDAATIESKAREAFGDGARIELLRADLCRADLLVEIEGIAQVDGRETDR